MNKTLNIKIQRVFRKECALNFFKYIDLSIKTWYNDTIKAFE